MNQTQPSRSVRPEPRTFESFPEDSICPICLTNDDGKTVLVAIQGTSEDGICEAIPMHLACAVAKIWLPEAHVGLTAP